MFTPDGRVREDFVEPDDAPPVVAEPIGATRDRSAEEPSKAAGAGPAIQPGVESSTAPATAAPLLELPGTPAALGGPSFYDLVAFLAEPVSIYLGDLELPDGESAENLDMARVHIDLIDLLRQRTAGNLTGQEQGVLEDLLYRLRVRYVQKRG